jgi:DNA-binding CsgD family transcriptional regulator
MTPEESSAFFNLLSEPASEPARRFIDFLADPDAGDWDQGITNTYSCGDYIAGDLQEHARGCNRPIAECRLCHLCELEIKRLWPDLWLSNWPGATAAGETHEFTALEFEVICRVCSGLPKKEIAEQCRLAEGIVHTIMRSIFDKAGLMGRGDLFEFVRTALNGELRRRQKAES